MGHLEPTRIQVEAFLKQLITEVAKVPPDVVVASATIDDALRMESVGFVELQVAIEDEYGIEIDPVRVVELNEFSAIVTYVYHLVVVVDSV
jgi:acyl carrier protein